MVLRRIGVLSLGKILGVCYACMGLLLGGLFTLIALFGAAIGVASGEPDALFALLFGVGAVFVLPILYGILGCIGGMIGALIYNGVAHLFGGLEIELEGPPTPGPASPTGS